MKVLVTGGTGFVGPKVVHALRARGHDVRALVRKPDRAKTLEAWGCDLVQGDMTDPGSLDRAVRGCDAVVHLVAIIQGPPVAFRQIMEQGTRDLVSAAGRAGVRRLVLMSALGTNERNRDLTPYFHAKWEMEQAVASSGLEHVAFRPSFVFGKDGGVLPTFLRQVRLSPFTPVIGSGDERFQPIWVGDVASFFAQAVDAAGAANRTFEIGGPDVVSWNEFYARVKKVLGIRRGTMHVPVGLARLGATVVERLPRAPITRDQLKMLTEAGDNVCDNGSALETFDVDLVGLDDQIRPGLLMPIELDDIRTGPPQPVVWITTVEGPAENVERAAGLAHGQLLAVYQGQPGWQGALGLLSFDRRRGLVLSFWESEQALLEGGMGNAAQFREGAAAAGVAITASERFEILFDEQVE